MLKKFAILIGILILIAAGAAHYLFSNLDSIVKNAIEKYGSQVAGTELHVSSVRISLSSGEGRIFGLTLGNPQGYSSSKAFEMDSISVSIDPHSVMGNGPVIIRKVDIEKPQITFEVADNGTSNLQVISNNAKSYSVENPPAEGSNSGGKNAPERKIIISSLTISNGQLTATNRSLLQGRMLNVPMASIRMSDIGRNSSGVTAAQAAREILEAIISAAARDASTAFTNQMKNINLNSLNKDDVKDTLKGLFR